MLKMTDKFCVKYIS